MSCEGRGEGAEVVVVEEEEMEAEGGGGGQEEEDGGGVVRWERFLPRVSVRVLLVESDDSTRQIIAALLRKCSYKVSTASDGLKAWEALKENSHNIDLVLTEVELPSISGFSLLTLIMDHETFKNIPVIMMSSHDSISMVFKCMSKGAADFLVKPIRKNELRNLWQHVWRRHISSGRHGDTHERQDEDLAKKKLDNCSGDYVACLQENKEGSEKGSDAQSSCTRSDMEAESTYMQTMVDIKQHKSSDLSLMDDTIAQNIQSDSASLIHKGEAEGVTPFNGSCNSNEPTLEDGRTCAVVETLNEDKPSTEVIDLIGAMDNQPQFSYMTRDITALQNGLSDASKTLIHERGVKCMSTSVPYLELSLRRYQHSNYDKPENDDLNTLNHSNSSAFSQYNSRISVPTLLTPMNSSTEHNESFGVSTKPLRDQESGNGSNDPCFNGTTPNTSMEDTNSLGLGLTSQEGMAVGCSPLRMIPFPIPMRGMTLDGLCPGYGSVMQPLYYPQAAHPSWSTIPSMWQEAANTNSSRQSDPKDRNAMQSHQQDDQRPNGVTHHQEQKKEEKDERRHASSVTAESGSSACNVNRNYLDINTESNISKANTESGSCEDQFAREGIKPTDFHRLREAALNKFRLKRKDRCYEKKVRYHSRKKLAEQRPRVKGQFVRQAAPVGEFQS